MSMPLTVLASVKSRLCFTFLVLAHLGSPGKRAVKRVCVCVRCRDELQVCENQGGYIFYAGGSIAGVSCRRRWPRLLLLS